jgi:chemotaxis response regulator CheB
MEGKLKLSLAHSSTDMCKGLTKLSDLALIAISFTSSEEKAFEAACMKMPDTIIWGIEWNAMNALALKDELNRTKRLSLFVLYDYTSDEYKYMANFIQPDALANEKNEFKTLQKHTLRLASLKQINTNLYGFSESCSDRFLQDPLF